MPTLTLQPYHKLPIPFNAYIRFFLERYSRISYRVEAEHPVDVHIVDSQGLAQFNQGLEFFSYQSFYGLPVVNNTLSLPFQGVGYLIIFNPNPNPTAIHYEIS